MDKLTGLIGMQAMKLELLKELQESLKYEACTYDVQQMSQQPVIFGLFEIKSQKLVRDGSPSKLRSYLWLRNIPQSEVYNYKLIAAPEPTEDTK